MTSRSFVCVCLFLVSLVNKLTWFLEEEEKSPFSFWDLHVCPPACVHRARGEEMLCHCWHCVFVVVEENTFTYRLIQLFCELIVQNHERRFRMRRGSGETTLGLSEKFQMRTSKWFLRGRRIKKKGVKLLCSMCNTNMKNKGTKTWIFLFSSSSSFK